MECLENLIWSAITFWAYLGGVLAFIIVPIAGAGYGVWWLLQ